MSTPPRQRDERLTQNVTEVLGADHRLPLHPGRPGVHVFPDLVMKQQRPSSHALREAEKLQMHLAMYILRWAPPHPVDVALRVELQRPPTAARVYSGPLLRSA